jgi:hypothetical protein
MKKLNKLRGNMQNLKLLPVRLGFGVMITFLLYCVSIIADSIGLIDPSYSRDFLGAIFIVATGAFFVVGVVAIIMVLAPMVNEFEAITKKS